MIRSFFSTLVILSVLWTSGAAALKSDRDQPALIEADEVEMDFSSGRRIYRGNVSVKQGTIRIIANEIELFYDGEQLDKAIAKGNPAVFRQRPDNKPHDVIGQGLTIELDEIRNVVTFIQEAKVRQGGDAITGELIEYDMGEDKMKVRGDTVTTRRPKTRAAALIQARSEPGRTIPVGHGSSSSPARIKALKTPAQRLQAISPSQKPTRQPGLPPVLPTLQIRLLSGRLTWAKAARWSMQHEVRLQR